MNRILRVFCHLFFLFIIGFINGQDLGKIKDSNARLFELFANGDTIRFIKIDSEISTKKPVLLVLQGSLPTPLGVKYTEGLSFTSFPYRLEQQHLDQYHVVVISMPHIPPIVNEEDINPNGTITDVPIAYNKSNFLGNYVSRANTVIDYLKDQDWVLSEGFVVFGHSQGSYVGIKLAAENSQIAKLGIFSCSPHGRFQQYISRIRFQEIAGELTAHEAQNKIDEYYQRWEYIVSNRTDDTAVRGDTFKATYSFSESFVDDIVALEVPVYIGYGTKDYGALGCDDLPIVLDGAGKNDYHLKAYPGLGHNFEEIDDKGLSNYDKMYWDEVFQEFFAWTIALKTK